MPIDQKSTAPRCLHVSRLIAVERITNNEVQVTYRMRRLEMQRKPGTLTISNE